MSLYKDFLPSSLESRVADSRKGRKAFVVIFVHGLGRIKGFVTCIIGLHKCLLLQDIRSNKKEA